MKDMKNSEKRAATQLSCVRFFYTFTAERRERDVSIYTAEKQSNEHQIEKTEDASQKWIMKMRRKSLLFV